MAELGFGGNTTAYVSGEANINVEDANMNDVDAIVGVGEDDNNVE